MDNTNPEYVKKCAERDFMWAEMRENISKINNIVRLKEPNKEDIMWSMICVNLVYADLMLFDEEYKEAMNEFKVEEKTYFDVTEFLKDVNNIASLN
jgi:hypothetical protein